MNLLQSIMNQNQIANSSCSLFPDCHNPAKLTDLSQVLFEQLNE